MMKAVIALTLFALIGCGGKPADEPATTTVEVKTMRCNMCVDNITKAVETVAGVKDVKVDLKQKTATVQFVSNQTSVDAIARAIAAAGYDANDVKRNEEAYKSLAACCQ